MNDSQDNHNLMSEKQAAARLGVARITLLRAREAGRIRFFRIGTRVLYCEEQLAEFLNSCERNSRKHDVGEKSSPERPAATRKDNRLNSSRRSVSTHERANADSATQSAKADQSSLPYLATR
jgi:excisionase family DNA binding protein